MAFDLEYWSLDEASRLTEFYNAQVANLPYAHAVSEDVFDWGIRHARYEETLHTNIFNEQIIVARIRQGIVGFVHLAEEKASHDEKQPPSGIIRFLSYVPGHRNVGQGLLEAAEAHLHARGFTRIYAFLKNYIYRFYVLGYGVCDRHGHITGLLGMNGYKIYKGEIWMEWLNFEAAEPVLPDADVEIQVHKTTGRGNRPNLLVQPFRDGEPFGGCEILSLAHRLQVDAFQDTLFVFWLGIQGEKQRQGWGRYLLLRAQWEMHKLGYKHATISTSINNHRALLFYTNYGYQVRDTWYEFVKDLNV